MKLPADLHVSVADAGPALYRSMLPSFVAAGARLCHFGSARDCLRAALTDRPGCVVVADRLADMSGLDLLRALRTHHPTLPVLMAVPAGDVLMAVTAMRLGATDVIEQPVPVTRLLHALVLGGHEGTGSRRHPANV